MTVGAAGAGAAGAGETGGFGGGAVIVEAFRAEDQLTIRITNPGTLNGNRESCGIGVSNSFERLRLLFGDRVRFDLWESATQEVRCEIVIPSRAKASALKEPSAVIP